MAIWFGGVGVDIGIVGVGVDLGGSAISTRSAFHVMFEAFPKDIPKLPNLLSCVSE